MLIPNGVCYRGVPLYSNTCCNLIPRPYPDGVSQPDFSPQLQDKIWTWPVNKAIAQYVSISLTPKYIFHLISSDVGKGI